MLVLVEFGARLDGQRRVVVDDVGEGIVIVNCELGEPVDDGVVDAQHHMLRRDSPSHPAQHGDTPHTATPNR